MLRKPTIYFLEIRLLHADIPVWRILEVKRTTTLHELHLCIQAAMGWETEHLYEYTVDGIRYGFPPDSNAAAMLPALQDSTVPRLMDLNFKPGDVFGYLYDFGDCWEHDIIVKGLGREWHSYDTLPVCRAGAMACPPENIGGMPAYNALVDFRINKTPVAINPDLEEIFADWDPYEADVPGWFSFPSVVRGLRRRYRS